MKKRNLFQLGHKKAGTFDMGELIPIGVWETVPGDSFQHYTDLFLRMQPMNFPIMHELYQYIHHWFIPFRLLWEEWEDFITGGQDGTAMPDYPTLTYSSNAAGTIADYLKYPVQGTPFTVGALKLRAMQLLWNECYRDQYLQTPLVIDLSSGADSTTDRNLQNVCWEKDYFTSGALNEQLGSEVTLPLTGNAPIVGLGISAGSSTAGNSYFETGGSVSGKNAFTDGTSDWWIEAQGTGAVGASNKPQVFADMSGVSSATVNEIRFAMAWQRVLENRNRYGSRYVELLRAWGVKSSDSRLQRPEYLGGGRRVIQISEVLQTANNADAGTTDDLGTGNLYGHGLGSLKSRPYRKFFEEHGFVISCLFVRPKTMYQQGIERMDLRRTREEFWQPELQHLGQQTVTKAEIYAAAADPTAKFCHQDRFDELRRSENSVCGLFRAGEIYDDYTAARYFASEPTFNGDFVKCSPTKDIFQVPSQDGLMFMARHNLPARRQIVKVGTSFIKQEVSYGWRFECFA